MRRCSLGGTLNRTSRSSVNKQRENTMENALIRNLLVIAFLIMGAAAAIA